MNILSKNFIVFAVSSIGFWILGWGLMFGDGSDFIGHAGAVVVVSGADNSPAMLGDAYQGDYGALNWTGVPLWAKFFFQLVFCGTAATIVSGAVAERIKYLSFIVFSFVMAIVDLPGRRPLDLGWRLACSRRGFVDFAGSTQVHSIGGWAALAGVLILGPRIGKYSADGEGQRDSGPQHEPGDHRLLRAVVRLVRIQSGQHDGGRPGSDFRGPRDDQHGRRGRRR